MLVFIRWILLLGISLRIVEPELQDIISIWIEQFEVGFKETAPFTGGWARRPIVEVAENIVRRGIGKSLLTSKCWRSVIWQCSAALSLILSGLSMYSPECIPGSGNSPCACLIE